MNKPSISWPKCLFLQVDCFLGLHAYLYGCSSISPQQSISSWARGSLSTLGAVAQGGDDIPRGQFVEKEAKRIWG